MYIPDRPFTLPTAPIRYLAINGGRVDPKEVQGAEVITSPNYVTGLAAALLSKVCPSCPNCHDVSIAMIRDVRTFLLILLFS